jgi:hypothetical protein
MSPSLQSLSKKAYVQRVIAENMSCNLERVGFCLVHYVLTARIIGFGHPETVVFFLMLDKEKENAQ